MTQLRVGTWNLQGGQDARQLVLLRALDLDVAALQECRWWDRDGLRRLHVAERELGLRGFLASSNRDGCHLVLLVREPLIRVVQQRHYIGPPYWHGLGRLEVRLEGFPRRLDLVNAHFAPSSPAIRTAEAETFQLLRKHACIALGDWNAAPANGDDPTLDGLAREHARRKLDRAAARAIEAAGFVDAGQICGDDTPTVGYVREDRLLYRCDRVYTLLPGGAAAILSHKVIVEDEPSSDHRPVVVTVALDG